MSMRPPKGKTCDAINGLIDEGKEIMSDFKNSPAHDAGLFPRRRRSSITRSLATARLIAWAQELGMNDAVALLEATLAEEKKTDKDLTVLAGSIQRTIWQNRRAKLHRNTSERFS